MLILAILAGLPWGIYGVALSIVGQSVLAFFLYTLYTNRRGPIRPRDMFVTMARQLGITAVMLAAAYVVRDVFSDAGALSGMVLVTLATTAGLGVALLIIPGGKDIVRNAFRMKDILFRKSV